MSTICYLLNKLQTHSYFEFVQLGEQEENEVRLVCWDPQPPVAQAHFRVPAPFSPVHVHDHAPCAMCLKWKRYQKVWKQFQCTYILAIINFSVTSSLHINKLTEKCYSTTAWARDSTKTETMVDTKHDSPCTRNLRAATCARSSCRSGLF